MEIFINRHLFATLFSAFLLCGLVSAQSVEKIEEFREKYPEEHQVYLIQEQMLDISISGGDIKILSTTHERRLRLNTRGGGSPKEKVSYNSFMDLVDIDAYTLVPNGTKYKKEVIKEFTEKDELSSSIFHDDIRSTSFYFPSVVEGSITDLSYTFNIKEPYFPEVMFFGDIPPVEETRMTVKYPKNVEMGFIYMNMSESEVDIVTNISGKNTEVILTKKEIPAIVLEPGAPGIQYFIPHVIVYIKSIEDKNGKRTVLSKPEDLHNWYSSFVHEVNVERDDRLVQIVDSIFDPKLEEIQNVQNMFNWVQDNIKYVAFEAGNEGFIPEEASVVCEAKYGDCKGMSSILTEMLDIAEIEAHLTWIGSRSIPYTYDEVPLPVTDNHMIVAYPTGDGYIFLDATDSELPFGIPTAFIQGKQAMVHLGDSSYVLAEVPIVNAANELYSDSVTIHIEENTIIGSGRSHFTGHLRSRFAHYLKDMEEKDRVIFFKNFYNKGSNKFLIDDLTISGLDDRNVPLQIDYTFNIENVVRSLGEELFVNMNLDRFNEGSEIQDDRELSLERDFLSTVRSTVSLELAPEMEVIHVPENSEYEGDEFGYSIRYIGSDGSIRVDQDHYENEIMINADQFDQWNEMIKSLNNAYKELVIIKIKEK